MDQPLGEYHICITLIYNKCGHIQTLLQKVCF